MSTEVKDMPRKGQVEVKKSTNANACLWLAADWLGQYSKILEALRPAAPVR